MASIASTGSKGDGVSPILYSLATICSNRSSSRSDSISLWIFTTGFLCDLRWYYAIPEYVLTYAFLVPILARCAFMQRWREILRFFGIRQKSRDGRVPGIPGCAHNGVTT